MSYADKVFVQNIKDILENGYSDEQLEVRPHWEDGTPAHTIKKFCIVNRYDLSKEFPIITVRKTFFKSCIDELLWIWQKKSNRVRFCRKVVGWLPMHLGKGRCRTPISSRSTRTRCVPSPCLCPRSFAQVEGRCHRLGG